MVANKFPPDLIQKTVLALVSKKEHMIPVKTVLDKLGFKSVFALNIYEGLRYLEQEMPHFILCESLLPDGDAGIFYDRLQEREMYKKIPMFVVIPQKSKQHLQPLVGRKFTGFFLGKYTDPTLATKLVDINKKVVASPYSVNIDNTILDESVVISCEATIVGKSKDHVVSSSSTLMDSSASVLCVPREHKLPPALLKAPTNIENKKSKSYFNLFPYARVQGKGLKWLIGLPEVDIEPEKSSEAKKILFFDPDRSRFEKFAKILKGYNIELIYAKSLNVAASYLSTNMERINSIYLHELLNDATAIKWSKVYNSLDANNRPALIIGTSSMNLKSAGTVHYIRRPFGLGQFLEKLEATFKQSASLDEAIESRKGGLQEIPIFYNAPAKLLALDEIGGVLKLKFPLRRGSKIEIGNKVLETLWDSKTVTILKSVGVQDSGDWYAHFQSLPMGTSKGSYWKNLQKQFNEKNIFKADSEKLDKSA